MHTLYAPTIVSVEGDGAETVGKAAVMKKPEDFQCSNPIQSEKVLGPYFSSPDQFAVHFTFQVTPRATGKQITGDKIGLYTVIEELLTREQFFYDRSH